MTHRSNPSTWPPHPPEWDTWIEEDARADRDDRRAPRRRWITPIVVGLALAFLGAPAGPSVAMIFLASWLVAVGLPMAVGRKPFGFSGKAAGGTVLGAGLSLVVVGGMLSNPGPPESIGAPDPIPTAQAPQPSPTIPARQPVAAGVFSGKAVVTQDVGYMHTDGEGLPPLGQRVPSTTLTLWQDCDSGAGRCTISYDFPGFGAPAFRTLDLASAAGDGSPAATDALTASDVWHVAGECVAEDGTVVGAYDSTVTFSIVLSDLVRTVYGPGTWSTADVGILIESVSDHAGCDPTIYEVRGHLLRQADAPVPASPPVTAPLLTT